MSQFFGACGTVFVGVGFLCAPFAAGVTFVVYVFLGVSEPAAYSIGAGVVAGLLLAIGIWWAYDRRYQRAGLVYREQYKHLRRRLDSARNRLDTCRLASPPGLVGAAQRDAEKIAGELDDLLEKTHRGGIWISAAGYLEAWSDLNRLEEAMIFLLPRQQVLAMAQDDACRLEGTGPSTLRKRLDAGIAALTAAPGSAAPAAAAADELAVRADLVLVRNSINRTREDQWGQLVGSRNNMMLAAAVAGFIAYLALITVVVWRIEPKALQVAASFVITGTLISLLHQVTLVGTAEGGVADFGQSTARLLSATFVSGLIALLGVVVLEGVSLTINGAPVFTSFDRWSQTFDWTANRSGFFWAAAFGFTPSWLFQLLQTRTDAIKTSLNASRALGGT